MTRSIVTGDSVVEIATNALLRMKYSMRGKKMNKHLLILNIFLSIGDVLICALAILAFGWGAWFFSKWWVLLFSFIPLGLYSNHGVICDTDIQRSQVDALKPQEKEHD